MRMHRKQDVAVAVLLTIGVTRGSLKVNRQHGHLTSRGDRGAPGRGPTLRFAGKERAMKGTVILGRIDML